MSLTNPLTFEEAEQEHIEIVRLHTSMWVNDRGIHCRRSLIILKRKSRGILLIEEDATMIGSDEFWSNIVNIDQCQDGIYQVITCNHKTDWESGAMEEYDYKLIPYSDD